MGAPRRGALFVCGRNPWARRREGQKRRSGRRGGERAGRGAKRQKGRRARRRARGSQGANGSGPGWSGRGWAGLGGGFAPPAGGGRRRARKPDSSAAAEEGSRKATRQNKPEFGARLKRRRAETGRKEAGSSKRKARSARLGSGLGFGLGFGFGFLGSRVPFLRPDPSFCVDREAAAS